MLCKKTLQANEQQFWIGLDLQSLQTTYFEIVQMVRYIKPQPEQKWIDLGAAYGRIGVVLGILYPKTLFKGYEYVAARVSEGNRILQKWNFSNSILEQADLADPNLVIEPADIYFIYDFGSRADIYSVLEKLRFIAKGRSIRVIARGRGVKSWILMDFPWLSEMKEPIHFPTWSLFQS